MAGLNSALGSAQQKGQLAAIAWLRWRIFVNSLRTVRGRLEVVSWILMVLGFALFGLGGAFGLGAAAWFFVSRGTVEWLTALLWGVFLYWQLFPVMATAFSETFDASNFLRFPLAYRPYFLIRVIYGALDPSTMIGTLWLIGIAVGTGIAAPRLLPWAALVLAVFAAFNILLNRLIFAWIERWLAQRKTREIFGIVFFLFIIGFQLTGPTINYFRHHGKSSRPELAGVAAQLLPAERLLPPGLASSALARASQGEHLAALGAFVLLCAYAGLSLRLLGVRMRAQYRGENLSETAGRTASPGEKQVVRSGWRIPGVSAPVAAIIEKEFRYLSRSGPLLFLLVMPLVILLIFRMGPANAAGRGSHFPTHGIDFMFPVGAAYVLLMLSGVMYNNLGVDAGGVQFFFMSPLRFRAVMLAKNLAQAAVLTMEMGFVWIGAALMFHPPAIGVTLATLAGVTFATIVNFSAGNLLSLYAPKKIDFPTLP
ncbi:MAG: hypothetical protein O8C63_11320 [Candidatus Methanoperedens sp.]|nr:hypothetical protein [Candidatus Methanoperedens sp.]